jgi:hypothetical protein
MTTLKTQTESSSTDLEPLTAQLDLRKGFKESDGQLATNFLEIGLQDVEFLFRYDLKILKVKRAEKEGKQKSRKDGKANDTDAKDLPQIHPRVKRRVVLLLVEELQAELRTAPDDEENQPDQKGFPATKVASLPQKKIYFFFRDRRSEVQGIAEAIHHQYCCQS